MVFYLYTDISLPLRPAKHKMQLDDRLCQTTLLQHSLVGGPESRFRLSVFLCRLLLKEDR